jgi:hypothetical protein
MSLLWQGWCRCAECHGLKPCCRRRSAAGPLRAPSASLRAGRSASFDVAPMCFVRPYGAATSGTDHEMESVSINRTAARLEAGQAMMQSAHSPASLGTLPTARSQIEPRIWRGKAWNGRAGQAFLLVEFGVVDRATANSSPWTATGHKQDGCPVRSWPVFFRRGDTKEEKKSDIYRGK